MHGIQKNFDLFLQHGLKQYSYGAVSYDPEDSFYHVAHAHRPGCIAATNNYFNAELVYYCFVLFFLFFFRSALVAMANKRVDNTNI